MILVCCNCTRAAALKTVLGIGLGLQVVNTIAISRTVWRLKLGNDWQFSVISLPFWYYSL